MKKAIRSLSLAAAFALLALLMPVLAGSGLTAYAADGFVNENGVLTEYTGPDGAVTIPNYITTIGRYAFSGRTGVTSVTIPNTVTSIEACAFEGCTGLSKVTMSNSVSIIEDYAFYGCESLKDITIPGTVTRMGRGVFYNCTGLKSIVLPDSVVSLGDGIFSYCTGLTSVTLSSSITSIPASAFSGCTGLPSITLPNSVTLIDRYAFEGCTGLKTVNMPRYVTSIGNSAFSGCVWLMNVTIPDSVTIIDSYAFFGCTGMTNLTIGSSVTTIESCAFEECKGLTTVTIPASVTSLGDYAFYGCAGLTNVNILTTRAAVASGMVFSECPNVTTVDYAGSEAQWHASGLENNFEYPVKVNYNYAALAVTSQPKSQSIALGKSLTLSVRASGTGMSYQWYFKKSGQSSFSVWNNRTHASETVTPNATWDGIQLYCLVKDSTGKSVKSNTATIRVLSIATQPESQTVALGKTLTLSVKATGAGLSYQWYFKKKGQSAFSIWNGHTKATETCTPNSTWDGIQLYCLVKDSAGNSVKSNTATVTLASGPIITTQPTNQNIVLGQSLTLSVKATGSALEYQWYFRKKGVDTFSKWNGRTHASETVTPNATWDGIQLYCRVTDGSGESVKSATVTVRVLSISTQPTGKSITLGQSVTLSLKATGSGLSYQWYFKKKGQSAFSKWNGHTKATETATPNATWNGIQLYCVVTDSEGNSVKSNTITVTVK